MTSYRKIPDEQYSKFRYQTVKQFEDIMIQVFNMHGLGIYIADVAEACMCAAELFSEAVRGKEVPITKEMVAYRRRKKK